MKYDKSLEQVWEWKDALYQDMNGLSTKERLAFIKREARKVALLMANRLQKPGKGPVLGH